MEDPELTETRDMLVAVLGLIQDMGGTQALYRTIETEGTMFIRRLWFRHVACPEHTLGTP